MSDPPTGEPDRETARDTVTRETATAGGSRAPVAVPKYVASFRILRELGAGGMGTVFEAHDERMNRRVALKLMSRHLALSDKSARRFAQEAWIAGRLDHPNLVKVYERGEWEELSFYAMELVSGGSLHDVVANMRRRGRDDRWGLVFGSREYVQWAMGHVAAAARALDYAHRQGVVHRDVKPMNLLLAGEAGSIKVVDFGLAVDIDATRLTTEGKVLGTLAYMAPEQILGHREQIDARTDVYALGVTLFELLTLELPYRGSTQQLYVDAVLTGEIRRPSKLNQRVGRDLETVLRKALEKRPSDRYPTAADLAEDLENVLHYRPIRARPTWWGKRLAKWGRRRPVHAALVATLIVAGPITAGLGWREAGRRNDQRRERVAALIQESRWFEDRRRYREVLERAERLLHVAPDHPQGLRYRAMGRLGLAREATEAQRSGELRVGALRDIDRVIELEPEAGWPHAYKAHILRRLGREDDAAQEDDAARRLRREPLTDEELELEAQLLMDQERYRDALDLYTKIVTRQPDNALAVASRGAAYDFLDELDKAYAEYRLAIAVNPSLREPYIDLTRLAIALGDLDVAEGYARRAVELAPESAHAHDALALYLVERAKRVAYGEGDRKRALDLFQQAETEARRSLELDPGWIDAWVQLGASLMEGSRVSDPPRHDRVREAVDNYEAVMRRWSSPPDGRRERQTYVNALSNVCDGRLLLGDLERALETCRRVTELRPEDPIGFYNLAGAFALMGRRDEALAALRRDVELGDTDWAYLEHDRWFDVLHGDPRFEEIVAAMKRAAGGGSG